jgi:hypothetical protein
LIFISIQGFKQDVSETGAPYWLKMVDANGKLFYVNKAYIKILLPAKEG